MISSTMQRDLDVRATAVRVTDDTVDVDFEDGRTISVPIVWFPRLVYATKEERDNINIMPDGIQWPDVEADVSIKGLLLGWKSGENPDCFKYWLDNRKQGKRVTVMEWLALHKQERKGKPKYEA